MALLIKLTFINREENMYILCIMYCLLYNMYVYLFIFRLLFEKFDSIMMKQCLSSIFNLPAYVFGWCQC